MSRQVMIVKHCKQLLSHVIFRSITFGWLIDIVVLRAWQVSMSVHFDALWYIHCVLIAIVTETKCAASFVLFWLSKQASGVVSSGTRACMTLGLPLKHSFCFRESLDLKLISDVHSYISELSILATSWKNSESIIFRETLWHARVPESIWAVLLKDSSIGLTKVIRSRKGWGCFSQASHSMELSPWGAVQ